MTAHRLAHLPEPLGYADALLGWFARLGLDSDETTLAGLLVSAAAQLSQCELSQLYQRDETTGRLDLIAQHLPGMKLSSADFQHEQLLHSVVEHKRALSLEDVTGSVYASGFLPATGEPWRALSCVPLFSRQLSVAGLLLYASPRSKPLQEYAPTLGELGSFALNQLALLQRRHPRTAPRCSTLVTHEAFGLLGNSKAMEETCRLIGKVLNTTYTVLLRGET